MLPRFRDWDRSFSFFAALVASLELAEELLALSATGLSAGAVDAAALTAETSSDFLGSFDLEREVLVVTGVGATTGLAEDALAGDHGRG